MNVAVITISILVLIAIIHMINYGNNRSDDY
jgi:hypothetical protein